MQAIAGISFFGVLICAWLVAARLLVLARRTKALPEAALGAMLLCLMGVGYPLAVVAQAEATLGLTAAKSIQLVSNLLVDLGLGLPYVFTWSVFRRQATWARALCAVAGVALAVHFVATIGVVLGLERMADALPRIGLWAQVPLVTGTLGFAWTAIESFLYRDQLAKRLRLGLAEPEVVNRLSLFGALGAVTALGALANSAFLMRQVDVVGDPVALAVTSCTGMAQAILLWLAFLPPARYRSWLAARAS